MVGKAVWTVGRKKVVRVTCLPMSKFRLKKTVRSSKKARRWFLHGNASAPVSRRAAYHRKLCEEFIERLPMIHRELHRCTWPGTWRKLLDLTWPHGVPQTRYNDVTPSPVDTAKQWSPKKRPRLRKKSGGIATNQRNTN